VCAVVATALAQIFTNTYQKSLDCNAMQLLYHTSPIIALVRTCRCRAICYEIILRDVFCCSFLCCRRDFHLFLCRLLLTCLPYITPIFLLDYFSYLPLTPINIQGMIVMCPFFDNVEQLTNFKYTLPCVTRIGETSVQVSKYQYLSF
jgi:hypothetical protein